MTAFAPDRPTRAPRRGSLRLWALLACLAQLSAPAVGQRATEEVEAGVSFRVRGVPAVIDVGGPAQPSCEPRCEAPEACQCTCDRQDCDSSAPADECNTCHCECL